MASKASNGGTKTGVHTKTESDAPTKAENSALTGAKDKETFVCFYGKASPFSQHHPAQFEIDGIIFNCAEQYMMYSKAVTFTDDVTKKKILASSNPVEQKRLGKKVKDYDKEVWAAKSEEVVRTANLAKFEQNASLRNELLATWPATLVEASPRDRVWGIGLGASNPKAHDRSAWRGQNKLGRILTEVREELREYEKEDTE